MKLFNYFKDIFTGLYGLFQGMYITMLNMIRPKVTEQYPENRATKVHFERFRGMRTLPHNANNKHRCTACGICMMSCPNGTIQIISKTVTDETTGRGKRVLDQYLFDLGSCTFCSLCTESCPEDAIGWSTDFEHALFTREKLLLKLNHEGSTLLAKKKED